MPSVIALVERREARAREELDVWLERLREAEDQVTSCQERLDRARIGRVAGELLEQGIKDGQAPDLDRVVKDGKTRLRQAAGELLERELDRRLGETDGRTPERR